MRLPYFSRSPAFHQTKTKHGTATDQPAINLKLASLLSATEIQIQSREQQIAGGNLGLRATQGGRKPWPGGAGSGTGPGSSSGGDTSRSKLVLSEGQWGKCLRGGEICFGGCFLSHALGKWHRQSRKQPSAPRTGGAGPRQAAGTELCSPGLGTARDPRSTSRAGDTRPAF